MLPYDPGAFFSGPDDPEALFIELLPTSASIHPLGPGPVRRWTSPSHPTARVAGDAGSSA